MDNRLDYKMKFMLYSALLGCFTISMLAAANIHTMREIRSSDHELLIPTTLIKMSIKQLSEIGI